MPMTKRTRLQLVVAMLVLALASPAAAQSDPPATSPTPAASPAPAASPTSAASPVAASWPSGDQLRRELQEIGFAFRVDPSTGDWLGWAPASPLTSPASMTLGGAGSADATAAFAFELLQTSPETTSASLAALFEVLARLSLGDRLAERARGFVLEDLLVLAPLELEPCYVAEGSGGAILATIDQETGYATIRAARTADALTAVPPPEPATPPDAAATPVPAIDIDIATCAELIPRELAVDPEPRSERLTVAISGEDPGFEPAEVTLEGSLVTLILTVRNDSDAVQTLRFDEPLAATTGPIDPDGVRLIVIRQLEPGEYPFFSETDPEAIRGTIRIVEPAPDEG